MRNAAPIALRTFAVILGLSSFAVLAAGACAHARAPKSEALRRDATSARGAGPVVGWGMGAPPPMISASAIALVAGHSCAIQASGAVVCWGADSLGQASPPPSVDGTTGTASVIAAGVYHDCAIQAGTDAIVCWGENNYGQAMPPPSVDGTAGTASAIAVGGRHSCAIQAGSGAVVCWGWNDYGQAMPPPSVDGTAGTGSEIAAGGSHSCAIQAGTSAVVCWGGNFYGEATPPPSVDGTAGTASAVAASWYHTVAIAVPEAPIAIDIKPEKAPMSSRDPE